MAPLLKGIILLVTFATIVKAEPPPPGPQNSYLPPQQGYNYQRPSVPFPTPTQTRPQTQYSPSPPSYSPPPPPAYSTPRPPPSSYGPPSKPPTYTQTPRPPSPRPTPYRPPATSSGYGNSLGPGFGTTVARPSSSYGPAPPTRPPPPPPSYGGQQGQHTVPTGFQQGQDSHHHEPGMPFDFNYAVKDDYYGTDYSHQAISDGDVVRGEYKVLLPDGRLQIVRYTADWQNGFNADVSYQGEARYPEASNQVTNTYGPPGGGPY